MKLGEILIRKRLISPQQLDQAIEQQPFTRRKLGEQLLEKQLISQADLSTALQEQYWRRHGFWVIADQKLYSY